jgi:hypothetical protein
MAQPSTHIHTNFREFCVESPQPLAESPEFPRFLVKAGERNRPTLDPVGRSATELGFTENPLDGLGELFAVKTDSAGLVGTCSEVRPATALNAIDPVLATVDKATSGCHDGVCRGLGRGTRAQHRPRGGVT